MGGCCSAERPAINARYLKCPAFENTTRDADPVQEEARQRTYHLPSALLDATLNDIFETYATCTWTQRYDACIALRQACGTHVVDPNSVKYIYDLPNKLREVTALAHRDQWMWMSHDDKWQASYLVFHQSERLARAICLTCSLRTPNICIYIYSQEYIYTPLDTYSFIIFKDRIWCLC